MSRMRKRSAKKEIETCSNLNVQYTELWHRLRFCRRFHYTFSITLLVMIIIIIIIMSFVCLKRDVIQSILRNHFNFLKCTHTHEYPGFIHSGINKGQTVIILNEYEPKTREYGNNIVWNRGIINITNLEYAWIMTLLNNPYDPFQHIHIQNVHNQHRDLSMYNMEGKNVDYFANTYESIVRISLKGNYYSRGKRMVFGLLLVLLWPASIIEFHQRA